MKPANERLLRALRTKLSDTEKVEERALFQGISFMVDGKLCIGVRGDEIMCRVGPHVYAEALEKNGVRPMMHGKSAMKGYVFVDESALGRDADLQYWVDLCLAFNPEAKASKKK
ncbi:MAG: TfoX/Sxy family protein [Mucilaginibacter polytrichastri]|nr:TfoX/Sxy family protein [Mucilaginibacter polytrichastri]